MDMEIIDLGETIVIGVRAAPDSGRCLEEALAAFRLRRKEIGGTDGMARLVINRVPGEGSGLPCECVAGLEAPSLENIPEGMAGWLVPPGRYARFGAGDLSEIAGACRAVLAEWLPGSGYRMAESPLLIQSDSGIPDSPAAAWRINLPLVNPGELADLRKWID
ncbi:MAG: GyrI-like domain-containing protein [Planctomycetota bacterium]|jgi:DNA gyrase inhibitor GyrI|nr:GyrI-like domain-containing protein [Planctomycetota bacterium]